MTRINLVDPTKLIDQHLKSEWRELPRIFGRVRRAVAAGKVPADFPPPPAYAFGRGHMMAFYTRLAWLSARHIDLTNEMRARNFTVGYTSTLVESFMDIPSEWWNNWTPTPDDIQVSANRLQQRQSEIEGYKRLKELLKVTQPQKKFTAKDPVTQVRYEDGSIQWLLLPREAALQVQDVKEVIAEAKFELLNEMSCVVRPPEGSLELINGQPWPVSRDVFGKRTN